MERINYVSCQLLDCTTFFI